jgi:hypothetical protein
MSLVDDCRSILAHAKGANDNRQEFRFTPQRRLDELLERLNSVPTLRQRTSREKQRISVHDQSLASSSHLKPKWELDFPPEAPSKPCSKPPQQRQKAYSNGVASISPAKAAGDPPKASVGPKVAETSPLVALLLAALLGAQPHVFPPQSRLIPDNPAPWTQVTQTVAVHWKHSKRS